MAFLRIHDSRLDQTAGEHLFMAKLYEDTPAQPLIHPGFSHRRELLIAHRDITPGLGMSGEMTQQTGLKFELETYCPV